MKLIIYKGFDSAFFRDLDIEPLIEGEIENKKNVIRYEKKTRKKLRLGLLSLEDDDTVWVTYEEYSLIKNYVDNAIKDDGLVVSVYRNNIYPDYYPIEFNLSECSLNGYRASKDTMSGQCWT